MSRYIKGDKVKFLGQDTIYYVKLVEVFPKATFYTLMDKYGGEKICYQAAQIRKCKWQLQNNMLIVQDAMHLFLPQEHLKNI